MTRGSFAETKNPAAADGPGVYDLGLEARAFCSVSARPELGAAVTAYRYIMLAISVEEELGQLVESGAKEPRCAGRA